MDWKDIGLSCEHCGQPIECKPDYSSSISIKGSEPMLYRHAHNKSTECVITITHKVKPYSNWGNRDKYYEESKT